MKKNITLIILLCLAGAFGAANARTTKHRFKPNTISCSRNDIPADSLLQFAQSLIGTRYCPGSANPLTGFDCSGFVSYVFKSFHFNVPRSSCDFANVGEKVNLEDARPGDIILFTGTKKHARRIGHIGIICCNSTNEITFIHSTSGKEHGVTITAMNKDYRQRFVQIVRLLKPHALS